MPSNPQALYLLGALIMSIVGVRSGYAADVKRGALLYQTCAACHSPLIEDSLGPNLRGVVGRKAGSLAKFSYSEAMRSSGLVWDGATLRAFVRKPQAKVPGTTMAFPGYQEAADADDLVTYLESLK